MYSGPGSWVVYMPCVSSNSLNAITEQICRLFLTFNIGKLLFFALIFNLIDMYFANYKWNISLKICYTLSKCMTDSLTACQWKSIATNWHLHNEVFNENWTMNSKDLKTVKRLWLKPLSRNDGESLEISDNRHRIQHLQPLESWGPSNHRSHNGLRGPCVLSSKSKSVIKMS